MLSLSDWSKKSVPACIGALRPITCEISSCTIMRQISRLTPVPNPWYPAYTDEFVEVSGPEGWGLICKIVLAVIQSLVVVQQATQLSTWEAD